MSISRVKIENYRSIENCEFYPSNLCALIGENNAGKSNILRAIYTVLGRDWVSVNSFCDEDFRDRNPQNDIVIELEFDPPLIHQEFSSTEVVKIPILHYKVTHYKKNTKTAKKGDRRLEIKCLQKTGNPVMVLAEAPHTGKQHKYKPLTSIPQDIRNQVPLIFAGINRCLFQQMPASRYSLLRRLLEDVDKALKARTIPIEVGGKILERQAHEVFLERLGEAFEVLRIPEFRELEKILRIRSLENPLPI